MASPNVKCPVCGSEKCVPLHDTDGPQLAAPMVVDEKVHVPRWYVCRCENGHTFTADLAERS